MAGGENYKEFDSTSIVTNTTGKDTVSIGKMTLRKRDLLLGGIAVVALLGVLILAIVLAVEVGGKSDSCPASATTGASKGGSANPGTTDGDYPNCITPACLRAAYYEKSNMNEFIDPCSDFYTYACGAYSKVYPSTHLLEDVTPSTQILLDNTEKLLYMLDYPVDRPQPHSYERKLKSFVASCSNHFDRMEVRGTPLITKVIKPLGGWYVFDDQWDPSTFNFHDQLKKVHIDYWTSAFFSMKVNTDQVDWNMRVVELDFGGVSLPPQLYGHTGTAAEVQQLYRNYMQKLAILLSYDAQMVPDMTKVNQFVDDAYEVELNMSSVILNSPLLSEPHHPANRMSLNDLNELTNGTMDFVDYMKTAFNEWPDKFTGETTVAVLRMDFFKYAGAMLDYYLGSDEGKRKVHNYLVWQLINRYAADLSWDYVHTKRQLAHYLYGYKDDSSGYAYCFTVAENRMSDAMNAVFIKNFVNKEEKSEADRILGFIRDQVIEGIKNLNWMSKEDQEVAVKKIKGSLYKIGFADYMVDETYMDSLYYAVDIDDQDFFGNILNLNKVSRKEYNDLIGRPSSRTLWAYHVFQPAVEYYNPWHELIATSAVLQHPLFSHNGPAYYNYGGVGTILARFLVHAVDEFGNNFRLDGSHYGNWWGDVTTRHYEEVKKCAIEAQRQEVLGPFVDEFTGQTITPNISLYAPYHAPELLADSSGLRLSYKAYKTRESQKGIEKIPPGFPRNSPDQMFFIAFAQAYCQNTPDYLKAQQLANLRYPSKNRVNLALSQVPEFRDAFNCPAKSPLVPAKTCVLF